MVDVLEKPGFDHLIVDAEDQFGSSDFLVVHDEFLCVPSTKVLCDPEICDGLDNDCDGVIPADETDDDGDGYVECTPWVGDPSIGGGDCNDTNANIFPGNTNANCDCADPIPQGTPENEAAGNCADGEDNDCDGLTDGDDPDCQTGCAASGASTLGASPVYGASALSKHVACFILPLGAIIGVAIWRRRR
jgi:hypothetical protein